MMTVPFLERQWIGKRENAVSTRMRFGGASSRCGVLSSSGVKLFHLHSNSKQNNMTMLLFNPVFIILSKSVCVNGQVFYACVLFILDSITRVGPSPQTTKQRVYDMKVVGWEGLFFVAIFLTY